MKLTAIHNPTPEMIEAVKRFQEAMRKDREIQKQFEIEFAAAFKDEEGRLGLRFEGPKEKPDA